MNAVSAHETHLGYPQNPVGRAAAPQSLAGYRRDACG